MIATATILINASREKVWDALVNPDLVKQYLFGTTIVTNWREGGTITWKGEWEGKAYEDRGILLNFDPETQLQYDYYSPMSGPDVPENHHVITTDLGGEGALTKVTVTQDNNATEAAKAQAEKNWALVLEGMKKVVEAGRG